MLISSLVFFLAVWYLRRYLDEQGIPRGGMTRGILVLKLASVVSWASGELVDWVQQATARTIVVEQPAIH